MPLVRRTRATFRRAEFGFLGVFVYTLVHTPRRWGAPFRAGVFVLSDFVMRPLRTSCWMVGTQDLVVGTDVRTARHGAGAGRLVTLRCRTHRINPPPATALAWSAYRDVVEPSPRRTAVSRRRLRRMLHSVRAAISCPDPAIDQDQSGRVA